MALSYAPELVSVEDLRPAVYNPREADDRRLDLLRTSLSRLGFVSPLYATASGDLLSGHQRLTVAKQLGCTKVPVVRVDISEDKHKNINLLFNRATNDMTNSDSSEMYVNQLGDMNLEDALSSVKTKTPDTEEFYPCMFPTWVPTLELVNHTTRQYLSSATAMCIKLLNVSVVIPVLRDRETGKIINGNYRAFAAAERREQFDLSDYPVIDLDPAEAHIAETLVNLISMRFTVEKQFGDILRYGGYRRPTNKVEDLVASMRYWVDGKRKIPVRMSLKNHHRFWHGFREVHGNTVADMGAGQRRNGLVLRRKGIKCVDWEPYPCDWQKVTGENGDKPSLTLSRLISNEFLDEIEAGTKFDSVFANAVVNSIPFHKDRMCFLALCHAICSLKTGFYGTAKNIGAFDVERGVQLSKIDSDGNVRQTLQQVAFTVPYESGTILADITKAPKVQKHHTPDGMRAMLTPFFGKVDTYGAQTAMYMFFEGKYPKRVNPYVLREALEVEFNMPYPVGRMELHERAIAVFSQRHNIDLADPIYAPKKDEETPEDVAPGDTLTDDSD